jgi:hypothetical protein
VNKRNIRTIIVDDEPLVRKRRRLLCSSRSDLAVTTTFTFAMIPVSGILSPRRGWKGIMRWARQIVPSKVAA